VRETVAAAIERPLILDDRAPVGQPHAAPRAHFLIKSTAIGLLLWDSDLEGLETFGVFG
jgi:hypothetical protein